MNRKDHWGKIYKTKFPVDVSWYKQKPAVSLERIEKQTASKTHPLIDVESGASTLYPTYL